MILPLDGSWSVRYHAVAVKWFLVSLAIAGCAIAGEGNHIIGGITDAGNPQQVTLSQTTSAAITPSHSFGCTTGTGLTRESSYYRVFTLADDGITTTFHVTQVDVGIQTALAGSGQKQAAKVRIGTYGVTTVEATLDLTQVRLITSADIQIPDGSGTRMTVPIAGDIAPNARLIVELLIPDGTAAGNKFFIGTNALGEQKPGYTRSPGCGYPSPTTMFSVASDRGAGETDIVMTVTGTH